MNNNISLQEYLKKYSSISNKFIDDFFSLYNIDSTDTDFIINLDNIIKWLNTKKSNIKKTLNESYQLDIDYKTTLLNPKGKGRPEVKIMLTPNCFKRLSMMSRTAKAEEVRSYFLAIEEHLDKYKGYIISALNKKVAKYEKELKPLPELKSKGVIYVLKTNQDIEGVYKIGRTENFKNRLSTHQSSHPDKLDIVYVYETEMIEQVENCLKSLLKDKGYRKRKEFYEIDINILKNLIKTCDCMSLSIRKNPKLIKDSECKYILHMSKIPSKKVIYDSTL
jgi:phage anti-repressor protein